MIRGWFYRFVIACIMGVIYWSNAPFSILCLLLLVMEPYVDAPENKVHISVFFGAAFALGLVVPPLFERHSIVQWLAMCSCFPWYATISILILWLVARVCIGNVPQECEKFDLEEEEFEDE